MNGAQRSKARVQNDLRFHNSPPLRLTSKLPLAGRGVLPPCLLAVFVGFECEILRERARAGLAHARQNGKRLGQAICAAIGARENPSCQSSASRLPG